MMGIVKRIAAATLLLIFGGAWAAGDFTVLPPTAEHAQGGQGVIVERGSRLVLKLDLPALLKKQGCQVESVPRLLLDERDPGPVVRLVNGDVWKLTGELNFVFREQPAATSATSPATADKGNISSNYWAENYREGGGFQGVLRRPAVVMGPNCYLSSETSVEVSNGTGWFPWIVLLLVFVASALLTYCSKGLLRDKQRNLPKSKIKASYSLARVQLFAWTSLVLLGAVYVWVIQGSLPALAPVYLNILGVSLVTRGGAKLVEDKKTPPPANDTDNFLADLIGSDTQGEVHRYQAVLLNVALLGVVAVNLVQNGAFPDLDGQWSLLLLASSGAYLYGKQGEVSAA